MTGRLKIEARVERSIDIALMHRTDEGVRHHQVVADAMVNKAMSGDLPAIRECLDRVLGKAQATLAVTVGPDAMFSRILDTMNASPGDDAVIIEHEANPLETLD